MDDQTFLIQSIIRYGGRAINLSHIVNLSSFSHKKYTEGDFLRCMNLNDMSRICKPSFVLNGHLSRPAVTNRLKRLLGNVTGRHALPAILLRMGFTGRTSRHAVGELLPRLSTLTRVSTCGISLLHFPWSRLRRVLPGTLPCGARTFLAAFAPRPSDPLISNCKL